MLGNTNINTNNLVAISSPMCNGPGGAIQKSPGTILHTKSCPFWAPWGATKKPWPILHTKRKAHPPSLSSAPVNSGQHPRIACHGSQVRREMGAEVRGQSTWWSRPRGGACGGRRRRALSKLLQRRIRLCTRPSFGSRGWRPVWFSKQPLEMFDLVVVLISFIMIFVFS